MYGFQAINAANGWMISFAGITIVFSGLVLLATVIANMERLLTLWDRRGELFAAAKPVTHPEIIPADLPPPEQEPIAVGQETMVIELSAWQLEGLNHLKYISERLGETFALPLLLERAERHGVLHAHSHLASLLKLNLLIEGEEDLRGFYSWRKNVSLVSAAKDSAAQ